MARSNNATQANYFSYAAAIASTGNVYPFSMACWFNPANVTAYMGLMVQGEAGGTDFHTLGAFGQVAGDPIVAYSGGSGAESNSVTSTSFVANTWQHACGVWASNASRSSYLNGGGKGTDTATRSVSSLTTTFMGGHRVGGTTFGPLNGSIAEAAIWNVALSDAEVLSLSKGISPRVVQPKGLVAYWPLYGRITSEPDLVGNFAFTMNGTMSQAAHVPRIFNPVGPVFGRSVTAAAFFPPFNKTPRQAVQRASSW